MGGEFTYQPKWDPKTVLTTATSTLATPPARRADRGIEWLVAHQQHPQPRRGARQVGGPRVGPDLVGRDQVRVVHLQAVHEDLTGFGSREPGGGRWEVGGGRRFWGTGVMRRRETFTGLWGPAVGLCPD